MSLHPSGRPWMRSRLLPAPAKRLFESAGRLRGLLVERQATKVVVRALWRSRRPLRERWRAVRLMAVVLDTYAEARLSRGEAVILLDEGIIQRSLTLLVDAGSTISWQLARDYAASVPRPDAVILLDLRPEQVVERSLSRPKGLPSRFKNSREEEVVAAMAGASYVLDRVISEMCASQGMKLFRVDASDLTQAASQMRRWIIPELLAMQEGRASGTGTILGQESNP